MMLGPKNGTSKDEIMQLDVRCVTMRASIQKTNGNERHRNSCFNYDTNWMRALYV